MFALVRVRTLSTRTCQRLQNFDEFTQKAEEKFRQNESKKQMADEDDLFKIKILISALSFVPDHGWSKEAITKGVEAVGLPKVSSGIVQPIDLIHFHYEKSNNDLELLMRKDMKNEEEEETTPKKLEVEKFLRKHVENRLRMNIPYLHQWPNALGNIMIFFI